MQPEPIEKESMTEYEMYDLIIVGGGPAGLTAGINAMRAALKTVLIERGVPGGQVAITKEVENYPGFIEIGGFDLCEKFSQHAKHYGLEIVQKEAVATEPGIDHHAVRLADGALLKSHAVVLAAGGTARKLNVPGETKTSAKGCRTARPATVSFSATKP